MPVGEIAMDAAQDMSGQEKETLAGDVMESLGEPQEAGQDLDQSHDSNGGQSPNDPLYVQKRLKQQKRAHEREIRALHDQIRSMQSQGDQSMQSPQASAMGTMDSPQSGDMATHIQSAVNQVLAHRDMEERKIKQAEHQAHVEKQYQDLNKHLDSTSDKYDDFDDIVRGDTPYTAHMRDAALLLPRSGPGSAAETLYKLGKNPEELERIRKLLPIEQARELHALSHALVRGADNKPTPESRPMGGIKSNPVVNYAITDKTPSSEIRARMKAGKFK
jgi:hypothetical protein